MALSWNTYQQYQKLSMHKAKIFQLILFAYFSDHVREYGSCSLSCDMFTKLSSVWDNRGRGDRSPGSPG